MSHALHAYLADRLAEKLKSRRVIVWHDERREFAPFVAELRPAGANAPVVAIQVGTLAAQLAEFDGSFFALRGAVEPLVAADHPDPLLIYLPGVAHDRRMSVLMELETAGECYEPQLRRMARRVLQTWYSDGVIDELLASDKLGYDDVARLAAPPDGGEPPSVLKAVFPDRRGAEAVLAAWLADETADAAIEARGATAELTKLLRSRLGLAQAPETALAKVRAVTLRFVLVGEFRADLRCPAPSALDGVPTPPREDELKAVRDVARRLRGDHADAYPRLADRVEQELQLAALGLAGSVLGSIDTFRFEEQVLLAHCGELIASGRHDEALAVFVERERSFWLDRDLARKAQWEACRRMAELGVAAARVRQELQDFHGEARAWVEKYERDWFRLDQAQRRLEAWVANLEDDPAERPLAMVRRAYEDTCEAMALGFSRALEAAQWSVAGVLQQSRVQSEVVAERPRPLAFFMVDALRFEMGVELLGRLPADAEVAIRPGLVSLPSITPVGMAALLPAASASFAVVEQDGDLGASIEGSFLPDLQSRRRFFAARVPGLVDLTLDELLGMKKSRLAEKVKDATFVVVRSQEIDHAGETGFTFQARQVMDNVIDNLARAFRKLAAAGIPNFVVTADHGHLFFTGDRDESMRIDSPGGQKVELHRRCWIGRGGATPAGCIRVAASSLGYASDLEFVFPRGSAVFKAGGDLEFHHGGISLQEVVVPVLTIRLPQRAAEARRERLAVSGLPPAVTNRIFSVTVELEKTLFDEAVVLRPLLISEGRQVGTAGMAVGATFDRALGSVTLEPGISATVALVLADDSAKAVRVVLQDPATDVELYRSPADIPVRLGV